LARPGILDIQNSGPVSAEENEKLAEEMTDLRKAIAALEGRMKALEEGSDSPEVQTNRRTRFQENGTWARHYSTVRMTTTTFLVGISLGILSFRWPATAHPRISFVALSGVVWILAVLLFLVFTRLTYGEMEKARRKRDRLPDGISVLSERAYHPVRDAASWIVASLTLFYGFLLFYLGDVRLWHFSFPPEPSLFRAMGCAVPGLVIFVGLFALLATCLQPAVSRPATEPR
jgi:hypothetical protein